MTVVMLLVCQTRRGDFGYIGGHMQWSYVYVQLSDCGVELTVKFRFNTWLVCAQSTGRILVHGIKADCEHVVQLDKLAPFLSFLLSHAGLFALLVFRAHGLRRCGLFLCAV